MREIKFRVFDKASKLNAMHIVGEDSHDSFWIDSDNVFYYRNLQNGEGSGECGDYIRMQYTGLKDNNGKEIYEGDIISFGDNKGVVFYANAKFRTKYKTFKGYCYEDLSDVLYFDKVRVIGNIYENEELIRGRLKNLNIIDEVQDV